MVATIYHPLMMKCGSILATLDLSSLSRLKITIEGHNHIYITPIKTILWHNNIMWTNNDIHQMD